LALQTTTIDVYPINNLAAPRAMHSAIANAGLSYLPATTRVQYRIYIDRLFRERGYAPISGYSYGVANNKQDRLVVEHAPKFLYHDIVYGYHDDEIIGFGASALSQVPGFNMYNIADRRRYVSEVLQGNSLPHEAFGPLFSPERGIVSFPYRGVLDKARVPWETVPDETWAALQRAEAAGLVVDRVDRYELSKVGWLFYVNLMYYLMPHRGKELISNKIEKQYSDGRSCGDTELSALTDLEDDLDA
jgi:coproporphyrinogen III oxidase-like Fe-S oxidoreductase